MRLVPSSRHRQFVLLAPPRSETALFDKVAVDSSRRQRLLAETQRLRGKIYLEDGAIEPWELSVDGRHVQPADYKSWHLLTLDEKGRVAACTRYLPHRNDVSFSDLTVSHCALAQSETWSRRLRNAIEAELHTARNRRYWYVEIGGWVISEQLRCTTEAARMVLTVYGLAQLFGGALGISTVTSRHGSSSILKRLGGVGLSEWGVEMPSYFDPQYKCQMEILRFDSSCLNPNYREWVDECRSFLTTVPVFSPEPVKTDFKTSLENLQGSIGIPSARAYCPALPVLAD